jgi:hypothetical protein
MDASLRVMPLTMATWSERGTCGRFRLAATVGRAGNACALISIAAQRVTNSPKFGGSNELDGRTSTAPAGESAMPSMTTAVPNSLFTSKVFRDDLGEIDHDVSSASVPVPG